MQIIKHAPAKVNLMLHITGVTENYHRLQSVFVFANSLYDKLIFDYTQTFSSQSAVIQNVNNEENTIHAAYDFLTQNIGNIKIPHVDIIKNIPQGGGLGGGSSDAACFIKYVMDYNNIGLRTQIEIAEKAHAIGMDVPAFLYHHIYHQNCVMLNGIGQFSEITSIVPTTNLFILIVHSNIKLSTKLVFNHFQDPLDKCLQPEPLTLEFLTHSHNSLQNTAISLAPSIAQTLRNISKTESIIARMSGSGASCFGLYQNEQTLHKAYKILLSQGYSVFKTY